MFEITSAKAAIGRCLMCHVLFIVTSLVGAAPTSHPVCKARGIVVYNVTFQTFWTRELFPKQYPTFRPHAQWSRLVGRSHDAGYVLWSEGTLASPALRVYAETGDTTLLDLDRQGHGGVLDVFGAPNINSGRGASSTAMFADARHSKMSLLSHLVPSPDWFVGLDSVSLCRGDSWIRELVLDLDIWDAGTDKGYTFTAPNWAEVPQLPIAGITASYPNNTANGFHYPELAELPTIARVHLVLHRQVDVSRSEEPQSEWEATKGDQSLELRDAPAQVTALPEIVFKSQPPTKPEPTLKPTVAEMSTILSSESPGTPQPNSGNTKSSVVRRSHHREEQPPMDSPVREVTRPPPTTSRLSKAERRRLRRLRQEEKREKKNRHRGGRNRHHERTTVAIMSPTVRPADRDCEVSDWSEWSPCSKTCGYGNRTRTRTVTRSSSGRGRKCPILTEEELCGTMKGCGWNHFNSNIWGNLG